MFAQVSFLLALGLSLHSHLVAQVNISGTWNVTDARTYEDKPYTAHVVFEPEGEIVRVHWETTAGKYMLPGLGIQQGNDLYVGWQINPKASYGVVVYDVGQTKAPGVWTAGSKQLAMEVIQRSNTALQGTHKVVGTNPDGSQYEGTLDIQPQGELYQLNWRVGSSTYSGIAFLVGDRLVCGWGVGNNDFGVVHYRFNGNKAAGTWAIPGQTDTRPENLGR